MKTSIWYHVDEKLPNAAGSQLVFMGPTLTDEGGIGTAYFAGANTGWRERVATHSSRANVVYWCDADPWDWYDNPQAVKPTAALQAAWRQVRDSIDQYEIIKALTHVHNQ